MHRTRIRALLVLLTAAALVATALPVRGVASEDARAAQQAVAGMHALDVSLADGTLNLLGTLPVQSLAVACPPDATPAPDDCRARTGTSLVRGLGRVSETYTWSYRMGPPGCPADLGKPLATTALLAVAGKGEIHVAIADGDRCIEMEPLRNEPQSFRVTGGTGSYQGASGGGTVERAISAGSGTEKWIGTLTVPGLEFDTNPPTLSGATSRTVRAKRGAKNARVVFKVTAQDAKDGSVPVSCTARSGSRFTIGRVRISCSAQDTSGNAATASFVVNVRKAS